MDLGCGLPAMIFLKDESKAMKVGIGMVSRGQVGLMRVAGLGVSAGALSLPTFLHHGHHDGRSDHDNHADMAQDSIQKGAARASGYYHGSRKRNLARRGAIKRKSVFA